MSIVGKIGMFIFSFCLGIGQGFQPVCSFNFGAKLYERVRESIKFLLKFGTIIIAIIAAICFVFAPQLVMLFRKDTEVVEIGTAALRFTCVAMLFMPIVMTGNMTFQSIGRAAKAFFLSCCQNGLVFIPLILILPRFIGVIGIELSQPLAFIVSAFIAGPMINKFLKELKQKNDG